MSQTDGRDGRPAQPTEAPVRSSCASAGCSFSFSLCLCLQRADGRASYCYFCLCVSVCVSLCLCVLRRRLLRVWVITAGWRYNRELLQCLKGERRKEKGPFGADPFRHACPSWSHSRHARMSGLNSAGFIWYVNLLWKSFAASKAGRLVKAAAAAATPAALG